MPDPHFVPPADPLSSSPRVPETYPPAPNVTPVRPVPIHWLLAPPVALLAMIAPRRIGPHVAAAGWIPALVAHFWSLTWAAGLFAAIGLDLSGAAFSGSPPPRYTFIEHLLRPPAALASMVFQATTNREAWLGMGVVLLLSQVIAWGGAVLLMPLAWAGETRGRLYLRCVRIMYWGTAFIVPVAYAAQPVIEYIDKQHWTGDRIDEEVAVMAMALGGIAWGCSALIRMAGRYPGPPLGPGWQPRPPLCERCGYRLTMQPEAGACPECSRPVADSLPVRRRPVSWATARHFFLPAFVGTTLASLRATRFARSYRLLEGLRAARTFAGTHCVLLGAFVAIAYLMVNTGEILDSPLPDLLRNLASEPEYADDLAEMLVAGLAGGLGALGLLLLAGLFSTWGGWNCRGAAPVVICYAFAWIWLPVLLTGIAALIHGQYRWELDRLPRVSLGELGRVYTGEVVIALLYAPAAAAALFWILHYRHMLAESRYANA